MKFIIIKNNKIDNIIVCDDEEFAKELKAIPYYEGAKIGDICNPIYKDSFDLETNNFILKEYQGNGTYGENGAINFIFEKEPIAIEFIENNIFINFSELNYNYQLINNIYIKKEEINSISWYCKDENSVELLNSNNKKYYYKLYY